MQKSKLRIVVDTNLWISFLISTQYSVLLHLLKENKVVLLFSRELLEEILDVAERPKMRKFFPLSNVYSLLHLFELYGELIEIKSDLKLSRDRKDNFLLNLSIDGTAKYLISGDNDLLSLNKIQQTDIIQYSELISIAT